MKVLIETSKPSPEAMVVTGKMEVTEQPVTRKEDRFLVMLRMFLDKYAENETSRGNSTSIWK